MSEIRSRRYGVLLSFVVPALSLLIVGSGWAQPPKPETAEVAVGITVPTWPVAGPVWVGLEEGIFAKNGLRVHAVNFRGGSDTMRGFLAGQMQFAVAAIGDVFKVRAQGVEDIVVIAQTVPKNVLSLIVSPEIKTPEDLKGKTFGVNNLGGLPWQLVNLFIKHMGWDPQRDVKIAVVGGMSAHISALSGGQIQAFVWTIGVGAALEEKGVAKVLLPTLEKVTPKWYDEVVYTSKTFVNKNPNTTRAVLASLLEASLFIKNQPERAIATMQKYEKMDPGPARATYKTIEFSTSGRMDPSVIDAMQEAMLSLGVLEKRVTVDITNAYLP